MNFIRRLFRPFDRRSWARVQVQYGAGYGAEVLFAGWVDLPKDLKESKPLKMPRK